MNKRWFGGAAAVAFVVGTMAAAPAFADPPTGPRGEWSDVKHQAPPNSNGFGVGHSNGSPGHVPELDPGLLGSAAVLLIGGTLVLQGRRRIEPEA